MAVNSNEFHSIRGFVELPQNVHADTVGLFKLVHSVPLAPWCANHVMHNLCIFFRY